MSESVTTCPDDELRAGIARATASPPVGLRLAGALRDGVSEAIHQDLTVTVLYLEEGSLSLVVVACDLILLPPEEASRMRARLAEALGVPSEHVLLSVSHSHATLSPPSWGEYEYEATDRERRAVADYFDRLREVTVTEALRAREGSVPVRVAAGLGDSDVNVNRRERLPDGRFVLGINPDGPVDREVAVVRLDTLDGRPLTTLFNYACHPDVLGPKSTLISPDFIGPAREVVEKAVDTTSLFLQGAAGDVYPHTGIVDEPDSVEAATRVGRRLGAEVTRVHETLNTRRRPAARAAWTSTASVTTHWQYENVPQPTGRQLGVARSVVRMPVRPLPALAEAEAVAARNREALQGLSDGASLSARLIANRRDAWARIQLEAVHQATPTQLSLELQALRIGDTAIVAVPGELFTEIGLAIKRTSPFPVTIVSAYSNGVFFYIPTREAFEQGGYEVNSHQNYLRPTGPTEEWESLIVSEVGALLDQLTLAEETNDTPISDVSSAGEPGGHRARR